MWLKKRVIPPNDIRYITILIEKVTFFSTCTEKSNDKSLEFGVLDLPQHLCRIFFSFQVQPANAKESPFGAEAFAA